VAQPAPKLVWSVLARLARRPLVCAALAVGALWTAGLASFVGASGVFRVKMPRVQAPPLGDHDLAAAVYGPTVRASSFLADWPTHHHPLYMFDERATPSPLEKWVSDPRDHAPWVEVGWREERTLERVVLRHGGSAEGPDTTCRRYRLICLRAAPGARPIDPAAPAVDVADNTSDVAIHPLHCEHARGLRVELAPPPGDVSRLYELEAWGR